MEPTDQADKDRQKDLAAKLHMLSSEQQERLARVRAEQLQLPYISLIVFPIDPDVLEIVPKIQAEAARAILFYKQGKDIRLGVVNPEAPNVSQLIEQLTSQYSVAPTIYVISDLSLASALARYRRAQTVVAGPQDEIHIEASQLSEMEKTLSNLEELGKHITSLPPTEVLAAIVAGAVKMGSSDIHIEPKEKDARLRYRIDGVLQDIAHFDRQGWALILSRIKVLAKLKLNVKEVPQDGSFVLRIADETYDMRVSTLPGGYGENIVMRLLNRKSEAVAVTDLGMKQRDYDICEQELKRANGMIVVTGPTGSGKTTTLASFVREINSPDVKIITLEDPIEYRLTGVEQTQVDEAAGYTFAKGLRSILRQDPDVILVGEMRDQETAETAVHAALTGHLVFTTLHTNDAPSTIPRLVDMGVKPFVLAPAINLVIAQRLVRIVCSHCAEEYRPDQPLRERIAETMRGVRKDIFDPAILEKPSLRFVKAVGCVKCGNTGYKGRRGLFEIFQVEGELEKLVLEGADGQRILAAALRQGMTTISQDGYIKVIEKITTIEEIERISED
jgi:type II secretory ATPase GspE/PulE/Tfp pilus assembly ATPase PilB-like protein